MDIGTAVLLESFADKSFAEAAIALLDSSGIESLLVTDDAGGVLPNLDFARGARVMVAPEDLQRAKDLLNNAADGDADEDRED